MVDEQVVLVTGASSGFGRLTVETLAQRGHTVFAGMRDPDGKNAAAAAEIAKLAAGGMDLRVVALDVTDEEQANAAVAKILAAAGRLDVLVNNAGIGAFGVTEAFTVEQAAQMFDTNVLGSMRTSRAVLPHMRAAGHGLLIQISTSIARVPMPFMGLYCATKAAVEMLVEEAHYVLAPLGIESVILEAGVYPTPMLQKMMQPADGARMAGYGKVMPEMGKMGKAMEYMLSSHPDPHEVANAILALIEAKRGARPMRTLVGSTHPQGADTLNESTDHIIETFYPMMGVGTFVDAAHATA